MKKNRFEIDMCNGPLLSKLISFSLPLLLSGVLQLMFNAVDLIVVGRFAGSDYLAAVGATSALINLTVNLFIGVSLGTNVCAANYYAAHKYDKMSSVVHTSILTAVIAGFFLLVLGQLISKPALELMDTPAEVIDNSVLYMRIYFLGMPFFMVYNFGAAILRAVGDTKRPMAFLILAGIINAFLNVIMVTKFNMDVDGVAIATVISQMISCVLVVFVLLKSPESYRLHFSRLKISFTELKKILKIGVPAGLQSMVINLSNTMLQSSVNSFGPDAMAGYTAANNLFGFLYTSVNAISQGCMSFTSQNMGAEKYGRMRKVLLKCLLLETVVGLGLGSVAYFGGSTLLGIYTTNKISIGFGLEILSLTTLTYFICGYMDCIPGALRGMGMSSVPMVLSIVGTVGTRIVWIYGFFPHNHDMKYLFICYPLSWVVTCALQFICYSLIIRKYPDKEKSND